MNAQGIDLGGIAPYLTAGAIGYLLGVITYHLTRGDKDGSD